MIFHSLKESVGGENECSLMNNMFSTYFHYVTFQTLFYPPAVPHIVVVLTDGVSNSPTGTISSAYALHTKDVTVFAAGVGDQVNTSELEAIASDPDCNHLVLLPNFDYFDSFLKQIEKRACQGWSECISLPLLPLLHSCFNNPSRVFES